VVLLLDFGCRVSKCILFYFLAVVPSFIDIR